MAAVTQPTSRANRRQLLLAAFLGLIAAVLVVVYLNTSEDSPPASESQGPLAQVIVAAQPIASGEVITDAKLTTKTLPESALSADVVRNRADILGQVARYPIETGEPVVRSRIVQAATVKALSFQIPQGMRGMTIPVSTNNTPASLLAPGDFVDVLVSIEAVALTSRTLPTTSGNRELKGAATILQNVQVLSVGRGYVDTGVVYDPSVRGTPPEDDKVTFVTLAVTPDQAQLLWLAQTEGKLTVVLRAFGDDTLVPLTPRIEPLILP